MQVRYDEEKGIYRDCKFCGGRGCLACPGEANKEYKRQFPNGPEPIATFKTDDPRDMERMQRTVGGEALKKAFCEDGGGILEIIKNLKEDEEKAMDKASG